MNHINQYESKEDFRRCKQCKEIKSLYDFDDGKDICHQCSDDLKGEKKL